MQFEPIYADRQQAGRELAERLMRYAGRSDVMVLGLPRGGVPVAFEVASALGAPLDVYLVRKLGVPGHEELAMGAVAAGGVRFMNEALVRQLGIPSATIEAVAQREQQVLVDQLKRLRGDRPAAELAGKIVILVDDGLATGATMAACIGAVRRRDPAKIVIAVPVAPPDTCDSMSRLADETVCGATPVMFGAVGLWYSDFSPVEDEEVRDLLNRQGSEKHAMRSAKADF